MIPPELEKEARALLALDEARTQGDWFCSDPLPDDYGNQFYTISQFESERSQKEHYEECLMQVFDQNISEDEFHANAAFVRAAPRMASLIRRLLEEGKVADGWTVWRGGERPFSGHTRVHVTFRDGDTDREVANCFSWDHDGSGADIIAYRIVGEGN